MMNEARTITQIQRSMRLKKIIKKIFLALIIYSIALTYFFPILYMFLSGFKTEQQAVNPSLRFSPTLETYRKVLSDPTMIQYLKNSVFQVFLGTGISLLLGIPVAFALVFGKLKTKDSAGKIYLWFITTILLPPVAVLIPLFISYQRINLKNNPLGLLLAYVGFNIPLAVWLVHSFFSDLPKDIFEAARIDGCTRWQQMVLMAIPLARTGIISAGLIIAVQIWNEFFLSFNLTGNPSATLPVYMSRFREQQGLFVAQLSASSTISILPALILGWMSQKALVKGLTMGAVKE
ncbi:ABC-type sugar transport system, permease component [Sphaerochaeta pleomorpha str. Grapes]|uniref:ABC-type sugar transport system, permease component n=1 Tax=Sphaerochaeta pleomorpha (strain ATCC BAA-1885 / DSM 22778 / Grapes) TaxID=158190 RepID=G8QSV3_SPHPG|nr:carbohydrate ABC transporter permease [Sphaerochaeta pleomorpha]AEV30135.1 ABC-type sugar transport system, permease component [Sphaerochaeta pleomorpha str. Grapes]